ncbi:TPA: hypothetical protein DCP77_03645 [Candidatus Collierbacteria bacterium]|nr:hypothetical protein [Candidatus Collierbacteria bacterium]HAN22843.1 hypothetical protein [Candidatus Collierbacteria bacterium]HAS68857.1 hypothetical protein [Candidatus Collierbacteria bacterium]HBX63995.1 hypothetical protein [Candidatus Collierbacteria bacterium]HCW31254.1 hypothetical protein [Candidatus Collierbacteria bacterium]
MGMVVVQRIDGERVEAYCKRVFEKVSRERVTITCFVGEKLFEVTPDMNFDYLQGYFKGLQDGMGPAFYLEAD